MKIYCRHLIAKLTETWTDEQVSALCGFPVRLVTFPFGTTPLDGQEVDDDLPSPVVFGIMPTSVSVTVAAGAAGQSVVAWYTVNAEDVPDAEDRDEFVDYLTGVFETLVNGWRDDCLEHAFAAQAGLR